MKSSLIKLKRSVPRRLFDLCWSMGFAATAQAQAYAPGPSVQIYGLLDLNIGSYRESGSNARSTQLASGRFTTSFLGFRGTEDLGGGLSAFFVLESHLRVDTGDVGRTNADPYFSRNAFVGLRTPAGSLSFGRASTPFWVSSLATNPFVGATGFSPSLRLLFGTSGKTGGDGVWGNSVIYNTPKWGGFSATIQHQVREAAQGGNTGINLLYTQGALTLTAAAQRVEAPYVNSGETSGLLGAAYDFGVARLFGQVIRVDEGATRTPTALTRDRIFQVGTSVPVGSANVLLSYARANTSGAIEGRREFFSVGYDYFLSKRTDLYAVLLLDKFNSAGRQNSLGLGVKHTF